MLTHLDLASVPVSAETPTSTIGAYFDGLSIDELQGRLSTWNTISEKSDTPPDSDQAKTSMLSDILGATIVEAGPLGIKPGDDMWRQMFPFVEGLFSQQEVEKHKEAGYQYILKNPQRINHKFELHLPPHLQAVDHYDRMLEMIADAERAHIMVKAQLWGSDIDPPAGQTYYRFWEQLEQNIDCFSYHYRGDEGSNKGLADLHRRVTALLQAALGVKQARSGRVAVA